MKHILHSHHPVRIFAVSASLTLILLGGVWYQLGLAALFTTIILTLVELTFSFDNSLINARILQHMSPFWQRMFMTIGILIAVFGMRVVFPIVMVMVTAGLDWSSVIDLALNKPDEYSKILIEAHPVIAGFGGMFLLMLGLEYFFDRERKVLWLSPIEQPLRTIGRWWMPTVVSLLILIVLTLLPQNHYGLKFFEAGIAGIVVFIIVHGLVSLLEKKQKSQLGDSTAPIVRTGLAGFASFMYLEVLDASFSFDGVLGALAITQNVILIAVGLGIGALWIRSMTLYIVRKRVLYSYKYLEHGAHFTILMLATVLLAGVFLEVPEFIPGVLGLSIIGTAVYSSVRANRARTTKPA